MSQYFGVPAPIPTEDAIQKEYGYDYALALLFYEPISIITYLAVLAFVYVALLVIFRWKGLYTVKGNTKLIFIGFVTIMTLQPLVLIIV